LTKSATPSRVVTSRHTKGADEAGPTLNAAGAGMASLVAPLLSIDDVAAVLAVDRRTVERLKSSGRLPKPTLKIGRMPRWKAETIRAWIDAGGKGVA
jgi:excisionase family DNA binding protein